MNRDEGKALIELLTNTPPGEREDIIRKLTKEETESLLSLLDEKEERLKKMLAAVEDNSKMLRAGLEQIASYVKAKGNA